MVTEQLKFFGVCVGLVILLIQQLHGKLTGTFLSTQRKCKDKQNLLFSTLAPGTVFIFSNKISYTWKIIFW